MRSESGQKETPAPVTVAKGGRGSSGATRGMCRHRAGTSTRIFRKVLATWCRESGFLQADRAGIFLGKTRGIRDPVRRSGS